VQPFRNKMDSSVCVPPNITGRRYPEIERDLISQRTKEVLRARKAAGMRLGRPKGPGKSKLDKHRPKIEALLANGSTHKFIANRYENIAGQRPALRQAPMRLLFPRFGIHEKVGARHAVPLQMRIKCVVS